MSGTGIPAGAVDLTPVNDVPAPNPLTWDQELALRDRALIFSLDNIRLTTERLADVEPDTVILGAERFYEYLVNGVQGE